MRFIPDGSGTTIRHNTTIHTSHKMYCFFFTDMYHGFHFFYRLSLGTLWTNVVSIINWSFYSRDFGAATPPELLDRWIRCRHLKCTIVREFINLFIYFHFMSAGMLTAYITLHRMPGLTETNRERRGGKSICLIWSIISLAWKDWGKHESHDSRAPVWNLTPGHPACVAIDASILVDKTPRECFRVGWWAKVSIVSAPWHSKNNRAHTGYARCEIFFSEAHICIILRHLKYIS
jgi:hypothetical protein